MSLTQPLPALPTSQITTTAAYRYPTVSGQVPFAAHDSQRFLSPQRRTVAYPSQDPQRFASPQKRPVGPPPPADVRCLSPQRRVVHREVQRFTSPMRRQAMPNPTATHFAFQPQNGSTAPMGFTFTASASAASQPSAALGSPTAGHREVPASPVGGSVALPPSNFESPMRSCVTSYPEVVTSSVAFGGSMTLASAALEPPRLPVGMVQTATQTPTMAVRRFSSPAAPCTTTVIKTTYDLPPRMPMAVKAAASEDTTPSTCSPAESLKSIVAGGDAGTVTFKQVDPSPRPSGSSASTCEPSLDLSWPSVEGAQGAATVISSAGTTIPESNVAPFTYGAHSIPGQKILNPRWVNQDAHFEIELGPTRILVGVLDGHGQYGHLVSGWARSKVEEEARKLIPAAPAKISDEDVEKALRSLFDYLHSNVKMLHVDNCRLADFSGSTATMALIDTDAGTMAIAHVGDSASIIAHQGRCLRRSEDHVVDEAVEARVRAHGGEVRHMTSCGISARRVFLPGQAYPGLAMARALGDLVANSLGVVAEPEVHTGIALTEGSWIVVASDGIWEKVEAPEVSARLTGKEDARAAAIDLVCSSRQQWDQQGDIDDITAVVVKLSQANVASL